jgi:hypothetical protein
MTSIRMQAKSDLSADGDTRVGQYEDGLPWLSVSSGYSPKEKLYSCTVTLMQ